MDDREVAALHVRVDWEYDRLYERLQKEEQADAVQWGGFFRRSLAVLVDIFVLCLFSLLLFYLTSIGYRVGMAAHGHSLIWEWKTLKSLIPVVAVACLFLICAYFVLLHGLDGRTVGKWLLSLRVVNARRERITYGQSFIRWIAAALTAPLLLGFLRILWHREKRGWHDSLARTWVIKE
jgi:uncharacterized RDD family membrane protein YckC